MAEKIYYENKGNKTRKSFIVSEETYAQWTAFCKDIECKSFPLDLALQRFMNDVRSGEVEVVLKFNA